MWRALGKDIFGLRFGRGGHVFIAVFLPMIPVALAAHFQVEFNTKKRQRSSAKMRVPQRRVSVLTKSRSLRGPAIVKIRAFPLTKKFLPLKFLRCAMNLLLL